MKAWAALAALGLVLGSPATAAAAPTQTVQYAPDMPLYRQVLANGLTVLVLPVKGSPVTTYHTWVKAGSRDEKPGITGIAHLFEHMMFRPVHPGEKSYFDQASDLGLRYNASTRFNATDFWCTFTPGHLGEVVKLEANRFKHLRVSKQMLDVEREAVRSELSTKLDASPTIDLWVQIYRLAYPNHPYNWHIVGYHEDLDHIQAEDCNRFFAANYAPNNAVVVVAGPVEPQATFKLIEEQYRDWPRAKTPKPAWSVPAPHPGRPIAGQGKLKAPTKYILIGYRTPERTRPDRLAQDLAHYMLFNENTSLVGRRLLDELHLASQSDAFNTFYDIAMSKLLVVPNPGVTPERIVNEVQAGIASFKQLPDVDFEAQKRDYATYLRESQLTTHSLTNALGMAWAYDGNYQDAYRDPDDLMRITRAQMTQLLDTTYAPANRVMVVTP